MLRVILATLVFWSVPTLAAPSPQYIEDSITRAALVVNVPAPLLRAICVAESNLKPEAYVYGDGGLSNHAFGMCQVLRLTAMHFGLRDGHCEQNFIGQSRTYQDCKLFGPYTNAYYAAKYLKYQLDRYGGSWILAIAAYNSGSVKTCSPKGYYMSGKGQKISCHPGGPINQQYVDRVLKAMEDHKAEIKYRTENGR